MIQSYFKSSGAHRQYFCYKTEKQSTFTEVSKKKKKVSLIIKPELQQLIWFLILIKIHSLMLMDIILYLALGRVRAMKSHFLAQTE